MCSNTLPLQDSISTLLVLRDLNFIEREKYPEWVPKETILKEF